MPGRPNRLDECSRSGICLSLQVSDYSNHDRKLISSKFDNDRVGSDQQAKVTGTGSTKNIWKILRVSDNKAREIFL